MATNTTPLLATLCLALAGPVLAAEEKTPLYAYAVFLPVVAIGLVLLVNLLIKMGAWSRGGRTRVVPRSNEI